MADDPDEAAGRNQVHGCGSYFLSVPSQPPDIRNWFSSYEYESPEDSELAADPGGENGSETQDPFEHRVPGHSLLKYSPRNGCNSLTGNCFGSQSEHVVSVTKDSIPIGKSTVEPGAKRKGSLRELFGASFLDDSDEATETESRVVSAMQRNEFKPLSNRNTVGLPDTIRRQEGAVEHRVLLGDDDGISSAETQENLPGGQETEHFRLSDNRGGTSLSSIEEGFLEDTAEHRKLLVNCHSKILADAQKSPPEDNNEHNILPVHCDGIGSSDIEGSFHGDEVGRDKTTMEYKKTGVTVAADGFVAVKTKGKPAKECRTNKIPKSSMVREKSALQENRSIERKVLVQERTRSPLADRTNLSEVAGAPAPELCGKWKCPRKGKPYVGPPLKQLRLEQWVVRRVIRLKPTEFMLGNEAPYFSFGVATQHVVEIHVTQKILDACCYGASSPIYVKRDQQYQRRNNFFRAGLEKL